MIWILSYVYLLHCEILPIFFSITVFSFRLTLCIYMYIYIYVLYLHFRFLQRPPHMLTSLQVTLWKKWWSCTSIIIKHFFICTVHINTSNLLVLLVWSSGEVCLLLWLSWLALSSWSRHHWCAAPSFLSQCYLQTCKHVWRPL
jgi:hypothetical protein